MRDNDTLLHLIKGGDDEALSELVENNLGLVKKLCLKFTERGVEYDDLVQIGSIGMIKAARSFDFSYDCVFSTYAVPLIIGEIRRYLRDDGIIKVSRQLKKQGAELMRAKEKFVSENAREPCLTELAGLCGLRADEAVYALDAVSSVRSLNERIGDDDAEFGDMIADRGGEMDAVTDRIALGEALGMLSQNERKLIVLRYYKELSQQQTGEVLGISQVKVSREEKRIITKLRKAM